METQDVPEAGAVGEGRERSTRSDDAEHLSGQSNPPLPFTLKSLDVEHSELARLGFKRATLVHFGAGYFTGKGLMHGKVALPFHNKDGVLVAYVGYTLEDGTFTYPPAFDRRLELYNYPRGAVASGRDHPGVLLVTDLLVVLRLYELGVSQVLALPSEEIHAPQLDLLETLAGPGAAVEYLSTVAPSVTILSRLAERFHVRLHRRDDRSSEAFLAGVVETLDG